MASEQKHTAADDSLDLLIDHDDDRVCAAIESYLKLCEVGSPPDPEIFAAGHPEIAEKLRSCLAGLCLLRQSSAAIDPDGASIAARTRQPLGDFSIVREIGRGGMGIVYEAEQLSLGRTVALKVLPLAATLDQRRLQRFRQEALAVGHLDHPHIVDVYGVGCERGIHYYAMRYVDGQTLAQVIQQLSHPSHPANRSQPAAAEAAAHVSCDADTVRTPRASLSTLGSGPRQDAQSYFRRVAEIGAQAASALEHSHQSGIIHRDIKPSNLMLDERGKLWVTDFGLALVESSGTLSTAGDLLGTLRYMSPEQAHGKSAMVDHRTDIYSLGVTLYELLTLRPAFPAEDRGTLLHDILHAEPVSPRRMEAAIPLDLQTIVLKAMSKDVHDRYQTAGELASDLNRFLDQLPISARPLGRVARAWRWCKRSPAFASVVTATLLLAICVAGISVLFALRETRHRQQAESQTEEAEWQQYVSDMHSAMAAWDQSNLGRTLELLERHRPGPSKPDLRGFEWNYLWRQCHDQRLKFTINETSFVRGLAVSHDSRMLATGHVNGQVQLWDSTNGRLMRELKGTVHVSRIAFSPDDRILASGDVDGAIRLWDLMDDPCEPRILTGHKANIFGLLFSQDGKQLASGCLDATIRIWDVGEARELRVIRPASSKPAGVFPISPWTDNRLWSHGWDGTLRLFDTDTGMELRCFERLELSDIQSVARVSWDGATAATGGLDGVVRLYATNMEREVAALGSHGAAIRGLAFSRDNQSLASSDNEGRVIVWDLATRVMKSVLRGHAGQVWRLEFFDDGKRLCSSGSDERLQIWDLTQGPLSVDVCRGHDGFAICVAFSPDGRLVASGGADSNGGRVLLWEMASGRLLHQFTGHDDFVWNVAFSPDGNELASASGDGTVRLWDLGRQTERSIIHTGHEILTWVEYSRDGRELIGANDDGKLWIWDRSTGVQVRFVQLNEPHVWSPALSPDGRLIAAHSDGAVVMLEYPSLKIARRLSSLPPGMSTGAFSRNGQTLAVCHQNQVFVISLQNGDVLGTLDHFASVHTVDFSPDGRTLVTGGQNHELYLWDAQRCQERSVLPGHAFSVEMVRFSPDGNTIASASNDGTVRFWRTDPTE